MRYLQLFWISAVLLAAACFWQFVELRDLRNEQATESLDTSITERYQKLTDAIQQQQEDLQALEATALESDRGLLSWLTAQADAVGVSIVGTSRLLPRKEGTYRVTSSQIEVEGTYDALIRFIHRLEQDRPIVRVDSLRFSTRRSAPGVPHLRLVLASLHGTAGTERQEDRDRLSNVERSTFQRSNSSTHNPQPITRNPFLLPEPSIVWEMPTAEAKLSWPELKAILWNEHSPAAIVSLANHSTTLSVGESAGSVRVERIEPNRVVFRQGANTRVIELWPSLDLALNPNLQTQNNAPEHHSDELGRMPGR